MTHLACTHVLPEALAAACSRAVDSKLGIIRRIVEIPLQPGEPQIFVMAANCTRPKYYLRNTAFHTADADYAIPANGVALSRSEALWRVLGEAFERYAAGIYFEEDLTLASRDELGSAALPVEDLIVFSEGQYARADFPFRRFNPHARIRWVNGKSLTTGRGVVIPAVLVYLGYEAIAPDEVFYPTLSTGMAAGRTLEQALLNGLCEVIERDAFMSTWLLHQPPQRISLQSLCLGLESKELALLQNEHFEVSVTLATTDVAVPSVLTLLRPRGRDAGVIGAAAYPSVHHAVVRSMLEAYHTLNWSIFLERTPKRVERSEVREFEDHVRYYLDPRNFGELAWLTQGPEVDVHLGAVAEGNHAALLSQAVAALKNAGYEAYFVETTTRDIRELGFRTVRVFVPGLHPLSVGCQGVHEDDRRLKKVAAYRGIPMPQELNSQPHPFP